MIKDRKKMSDKKVVKKVDEFIDKKELTIKQARWLHKYIETGNATEAAMQVYDIKDRYSAGSIGSENLRKLAIKDLMEEMGLTDVALVNMIAEGATKPMKIHGTGDNFVEMPDYATRHKYVDTAVKLKDKMPKDPGSTFAARVDGDKIEIVITDY